VTPRNSPNGPSEDGPSLRRILRAGNDRATAVAAGTLTAVREAMDMVY
jgi:hypothetical protein